MRLRKWCETVGVSYRTAMRWMANGQFPEPFTQTATGTLLIHVEETVEARLTKELEAVKDELAKLKGEEND